jgi:hypothetical protein
VTDTPNPNPDADPAAAPTLDPLSQTGAPPSVQPYTDAVEEEGARFAREADEDDGMQRPATGGDPGGGDLTPDFLAPTQPS